MGFYSENPIKAIRKARQCDGCGRFFEIGCPALKCAGVEDGQFWSATYHVECRRAEIALNELHDIRFGDEWMPLSDIDWEDFPWLIEGFPEVAARMKITTKRFERIQREREETYRAWRAIDAKRRAVRSDGMGGRA